MPTVKHTVHALAYSLASFIAKGAGFSFMLGSKLAYFSIAQFLAPLTGAWSGAQTSILVWAMRTVVSGYMLGLSPLLCLVYHVPTLGASLYLASSHKLIRAGIPLACIALFIVHPVGSLSMSYALYWALPVALAYYMPKNFFWQALGSTFTAHALGTVCWLYSNALSTGVIQQLGYIVWAERLVFALGMTCVYYSGCYVYNSLLNRALRPLSNRVEWSI